METSLIYIVLEQLDKLKDYIDIHVITLFILSGFFAKRYLKKITFINLTYKTLILGSILTGILMLINIKHGKDVDWVKFFISYTVATSFYQIFIKLIVDFIFKKFNINLNAENEDQLTNKISILTEKERLNLHTEKLQENTLIYQTGFSQSGFYKLVSSKNGKKWMYIGKVIS